ncbi:MAG: hypothetical protein M9958_00890 [Chitinophagales bacterium]|nr:hypothetical protein [Chitinophagales bacterium]
MGNLSSRIKNSSSNMKGIIFTPEIDIHTEIEKISALFDLGIDHLILRKSGIEMSYWYAYIEQFPYGYESKILTYDFQLLHDLNLGGFVFDMDIVNQLSDKDLFENIRLLKSQNKLSVLVVNDLESLRKYDSKFDLIIVETSLDVLENEEYMNHNWVEYITKREQSTTCLSIKYSDDNEQYDDYLCAYDYTQYLWNEPDSVVERFKSRRNGNI